MNKNKTMLQLIFLFITLISQAQEKKVAPTSAELFTKIEQMDKLVFDAFNKRDLQVLKSLFSDDLEWFQDNGGLLPYETVFSNFDEIFHKDYQLTRTLVKGSLEVHPIKDYGAIEIGTHQFRHIENGKEEIGTFKFLMIWKKENDQWKISRVISYDH